jgi:hypothetical protein
MKRNNQFSVSLALVATPSELQHCDADDGQ